MTTVFNRIAPIVALASLTFGLWYALGAWGVVAYPL